jgi:hypothetical protein
MPKPHIVIARHVNGSPFWQCQCRGYRGEAFRSWRYTYRFWVLGEGLA